MQGFLSTKNEMCSKTWVVHAMLRRAEFRILPWEEVGEQFKGFGIAVQCDERSGQGGLVLISSDPCGIRSSYFVFAIYP